MALHQMRRTILPPEAVGASCVLRRQHLTARAPDSGFLKGARPVKRPAGADRVVISLVGERAQKIGQGQDSDDGAVGGHR